MLPPLYLPLLLPSSQVLSFVLLLLVASICLPVIASPVASFAAAGAPERGPCESNEAVPLEPVLRRKGRSSSAYGFYGSMRGKRWP